MELEQLWRHFADRMSEIELLHRASKDTANRELELISEYSSSLQGDEGHIEPSRSIHNMYFQDARSGKPKTYSQETRTLQQRRLDVLLHKNKQYQWLLAEAYEEFEDFLENLYALYGSANHAFWPLNDFGSISLSELPGREYSWFVERAKKKKNIPQSILNRFRQKFPELECIERENAFGVHLSVAITLIEQLRHIIVHRGGNVENKEEFICSVAQAAGVYNNGNIPQTHLALINRFFGNSDYSNMIAILEIPVHPNIPLDIHVSLFSVLTGYLMSYAFLLYEFVEKDVSSGRSA